MVIGGSLRDEVRPCAEALSLAIETKRERDQ